MHSVRVRWESYLQSPSLQFTTSSAQEPLACFRGLHAHTGECAPSNEGGTQGHENPNPDLHPVRQCIAAQEANHEFLERTRSEVPKEWPIGSQRQSNISLKLTAQVRLWVEGRPVAVGASRW